MNPCDMNKARDHTLTRNDCKDSVCHPCCISDRRSASKLLKNCFIHFDIQAYKWCMNVKRLLCSVDQGLFSDWSQHLIQVLLTPPVFLFQSNSLQFAMYLRSSIQVFPSFCLRSNSLRVKCVSEDACRVIVISVHLSHTQLRSDPWVG